MRRVRPMTQKVTLGHKALVEAAHREIETIPIADALKLHGNQDVVFVDIRDIRELQREGRIPECLSRATGHARILDRPDFALSQADLCRGQEIRFLLRGRDALCACHKNRSRHGPEARRAHGRWLRCMEEGRRTR